MHKYNFCLFIRSDYECFQIELAKNYGLTEWREDIKKTMFKAGLKNQQITFLFVDTQVQKKKKKKESALETFDGSCRIASCRYFSRSTWLTHICLNPAD